MPAVAICIPAARDADDDDVQCALTVASACAERGDAHDAVKWLRRASRAAADSEDVGRAVELSKAASEAESIVRAGPPPSRPRAVAMPLTATRPSVIAPERPRASARRTPPATPVLSASWPSARPDETRAEHRSARSAPATPPPKAPPKAPPPRVQPALRVAPVLHAAPPHRRRFGSDLEPTEPRMLLPSEDVWVPISSPGTTVTDFALVPLIDDDLDEPTETRQRPSTPRKSATRTTDPIGRSLQEGEIGSLADTLEPPSRLLVETPSRALRAPEAAALSATRVAVYPGLNGRPEVVFLPAGRQPPPGSAVALIVPTSADDAALLAAMVRVFEHGRAAG